MSETGSVGSSFPVSRGSVVDSELSRLMKRYPQETKFYLDDLYATETKRHPDHQMDPSVNQNRTGLGESKTHYQETFIPKSTRPRSSKRPLPPVIHPPQGPMASETWQRSSYKPHGPTARQEPIKFNDNYETSHAPFSGMTSYRQVYTPKKIDRVLPERRPSQHRTGADGESNVFQDQTTMGEAYKAWTVRPNLKFGELPVFTGSILYPSAERNMISTTRETYDTKQGVRPEMAKVANATLKMEGEQDFTTTHRNTYRPLTPNAHRAAQMKRPTDRVDDRQHAAFCNETQFMRDFPGFEGNQPKPPRAMNPAQPTIQLKYDHRSYFETEQRRQFGGHDPKEHPVPKPFKKDSENYQRPTEKFANKTVTGTDFAPVDSRLLALRTSAIRPQDASGGKIPGLCPDGAFSGATTSNDFYKDWTSHIQPRTRFGDIHEATSWVPPVNKLSNETETRHAFYSKDYSPTETFKPVEQPIAQAGQQDFRTVYRTAFTGEKYRMSKNQAAELKRELLRLQEGGAVPHSQAVAVA